jgi:hypothetical protein
MPYFTVGVIRSTITGTFTYNAINSCSSPPDPDCTTIAGSVVSYSQTRNGAVFGFGAEMPLPALGPGFVLFGDYSRAQFGSFTVNLPVAIASTPGPSPCVPTPGFSCATTDVGKFSNVNTNTVSLGLRLKFL